MSLGNKIIRLNLPVVLNLISETKFKIMSQNQSTDTPQQPSFIPAGWIGGFSEKVPGQPYPNIALLNQLNYEENMAHIDRITRMLRAKWPEFSWETTKGDPSTRMYQMFAPDISRLGYDNK